MVGVGADITEQHAQQEARLTAEAATEIARSAAAAEAGAPGELFGDVRLEAALADAPAERDDMAVLVARVR